MSEPLSRAAFIATVATMLAGLALHARWLPPVLMAVLAAIIVLRVLWRWRSGRRVPALVRLGLVVVMSLVVWRTLGSLFGREAGSALLSAMLVVKLLETETVRDARLVATVTCFIALSGFLFDQGPLQMVLATGVVVLVFATLYVLDRGPVRRAILAPAAEARAGVGEAIRYTLLAVPFAVVCFVLFPRFSAPLWGAPQDGFAARTGISDRMSPGGISSLALDDTPVMRVRFDGALPAPAQRYWRGLVLWSYDGETWLDTERSRMYRDAPRVRPLVAPVSYEVWLEPTDQRWLFLLDVPLAPPEDARLTSDLQARRREPVTTVLNYRAEAVLRAQVQAEAPLYLRSLGLQLPDGGNPLARELAQRWRDETGDDAAAIAERALALFNGEFVYTFEPPLLSATDGIDDFLFNVRAGFCEHYASAFTYLMRAANVPARVVVGFQGGIWNASGGYLVVRRSDAHAWAEIWLAGEGWTRVDPTAAIAPDRVDSATRAALAASEAWYRSGWLGALGERLDVAGMWWKRAVVQFNALRQRNLLDRWGVDPDRDRSRWSALLVIAGIVALLAGGLLVGLGRRARGDALARAWQRVLTRLAGVGIVHRAPEGPETFARRVARDRPDLAVAIAALSARYIALRYAVLQPDGDDVRVFARSAGAFRPRRR